MNAVIYARYSSDKQTEQSIEGQLRVCYEYAKNNNLTILTEYIDRAITGTNDNRPAFLQMIEDSELKKFDYIIVYKFDRFSRNKYDSVVYKHKLKEYGVKVVSATEAISDSPEGELMEGLLEMFAEMYSKDLSQKVKRGMRENIIKGNSLGGYPLYGYKVVNKKILIDEEKAPAIRYLFEEYASGKPKKQIIKELNAMGYKSNKGKPLSYNSFQDNLKNIKYTGHYEYGEIVNDSLYPQIISKELFDRVQKKLKEHKHAPATQKAKIEYLLTGKLFCGHCGAKLVGVSGTSSTKDRHHYYVCSCRYKEHKCNKSYEHKKFLEDYVIENILQYIYKDENLEEIAEAILQEYKNDKFNIKLGEFKTKINQIDTEIDRCFKNFCDAESSELRKRIDAQVKDLTTLKEDLQTELDKLELANKLNHSKEDIIKWLKLFTQGQRPDEKYYKRLIEYFISCVYVYDDKIALFFNLFGDKTLSLSEVEEHIQNTKTNTKVHILNGTLNHYTQNKNRVILITTSSYFGLLINRC